VLERLLSGSSGKLPKLLAAYTRGSIAYARVVANSAEIHSETGRSVFSNGAISGCSAIRQMSAARIDFDGPYSYLCERGLRLERPEILRVEVVGSCVRLDSVLRSPQ
jgi:hypothetical protein